MNKKPNIILSFIMVSLIVSVCSICVVQDNPSLKTENNDKNIKTETLVPKTSGYAVTQKWKWENPWSGDQDALQVEMSLDGNYIVARWSDPIGGANPNVTLFKKDSNETVWIYESPELNSNIIDVAISGNGNYIAASNLSHVLLLDNSPESSKKELWKFPNYPNINNKYVDISLSGDYICGINGSHIFLLDKAGDVEWVYDTQDDLSSEAVAISGNGKYIIAGSYSNEYIYLFNTTDYKGTYMWKYMGSSPIKNVAISDDGKYAVASTTGDDIFFFNTTDYDQLASTPYGIPMWSWHTTGTINDLAISSDGKNVVASATTGFFYFNNSFSPGEKLPMWSYDTNPNEPRTIDINADGVYVVGGSIPGPTAYLFNNSVTNSKEPEWIFADDIGEVAISGWGNYFMVANLDQEIYLFHHARPIPPVLGLLIGDDDDDDDDETTAIPFGNYYLLLAVIAIVSLIVIAKQKVILTKN